MPLTSNPDAFYLGDEEFFERFGFERPRAVGSRDGGKGEGDGRGTRAESPFSPVMKARAAGSWGGEGVEGDRGRVDREKGYGEHGDGNVRARAMGEGGGGDAGRGAASEGVEEVVFYCKAGVRSRAAARMAREWTGVRVGDMTGGWIEWEGRGGKVER